VNKLNFVDDDDVDDALYQKNTFGALLVVIVWINNYLCNQLDKLKHIKSPVPVISH
jgi:hypothetical protein